MLDYKETYLLVDKLEKWELLEYVEILQVAPRLVYIHFALDEIYWESNGLEL